MSTPETERFMFDISAGALVVGEAAYAECIEAGTDPRDMLPLRDLLINDSVDVPALPLQPMDVKRWRVTDFVSYTKWLGHEVVTDEVRFDQDIFDRAYRLGIGPSVRKIDRVGGTSELYERAELKNVYKRGMYDNVTREDIAQYVGKMARRTPKTESLRDKINQAARDGMGPSAKIISRRVGSIGNALVLDGLVDPQTMQREDYLDWGVKFYLANGGQTLDTDALEYMSPIRLSPSRSAIVRNFGSLEAFRIEVEPLYAIEAKQREEAKKQKFTEIMQALGDSTVPPQTLSHTTNTEEMFQAYGKYRVVTELLPELSEKLRIKLAKMTPKGFVSSIIRLGEGNISAGEIETTAEDLGVFDDIWPFDNFMQTMKLPSQF